MFSATLYIGSSRRRPGSSANQVFCRLDIGHISLKMKEIEQLLLRAEAVLARLEPLLPSPVAEVDWHASHAFRWRVPRDGRGYLKPVKLVSAIQFDDLHNISQQKEAIEQNTRQFVTGKPANNVLLTGARGTGKSSLIKACLAQFAAQYLPAPTTTTDNRNSPQCCRYCFRSALSAAPPRRAFRSRASRQ